MKSSALFERGPLPPYVHHVIGAPRRSPYYTEHKPKNKKRGRAGDEATYNHVRLHNVRMRVHHGARSSWRTLHLISGALHLISVPRSVPRSCVPAFTYMYTLTELSMTHLNHLNSRLKHCNTITFCIIIFQLVHVGTHIFGYNLQTMSY